VSSNPPGIVIGFLSALVSKTGIDRPFTKVYTNG
jgi:hypothetical protein